MSLSFRHIGLLIMFIGFISFPLINSFVTIVKDTENLENRALAKKPELDIEHLDPFPAKYESYYTDHFTIRSLSIKCFNLFNLRVFNKSPLPHMVVIGNEDWLFLGSEMGYYIGYLRLSQEQLEAYKRDLEFQQRYLREKGCELYVMIIPVKAAIYPHKVPYTIYRCNNISMGEQLTDYLKKNSSVPMISLYEPFKALSKEHLLYYKHDNHWNKKGAFFASVEACKEIGKTFKDIKPLSLDDYEINEVSKDEGDLVRILGNPDFYEDLDYDFISKKTKRPLVFDPIDYSASFARHRQSQNGKGTKILLLGDSFNNLFFPFMAENFGHTINLFDSWKYRLQKDSVEVHKPNVYLLMMHEPQAYEVRNNQN